MIVMWRKILVGVTSVEKISKALGASAELLCSLPITRITLVIAGLCDGTVWMHPLKSSF